ncbi:hypothetical protein TSUD_313150 [Trifolium subterraneum]|uniref:Uncharacterized protein n=1 Tax=Trifolium subterraneum TaxID=3900 RepID=A0A2Z6M7E0_TRISU|nr:hypothetical protein TSUD_313150 [Trifolium subterraneum]
MRNATPVVQKSFSDCLFSVAECDSLENKLREQHNIVITSKQIRSNLNAAYYAFEEYCLLMKEGREGLRFDRETGEDKLANINFSHTDVILNFNSLRLIFPFLWDKYFKDGSKKRSGSLYAASSSKRTRDTYSSKSLKSFSSVHPNSNVIWKVIDRIQELFGNGPNKLIPKAYVDAAKIHYGADENEGKFFLAYNDDDAKEDFASKANIVI